MFILFAGNNYEPNGGAKDIYSIEIDLTIAIKKAKDLYENNPYIWTHIYDTDTKEIVYDDNDNGLNQSSLL